MSAFRAAAVLAVFPGLGIAVAHAGTPQEDRNKANAIAYYETENTKDWAAARTYVSDDYIEHHPSAPKDISGIKFLENFYKSLPVVFPNHQAVILRALAENDMVVLHIRDIEDPGRKGTALIAFFRFDDKGKIAEHWHALQPVAGPLNSNGMF